MRLVALILLLIIIIGLSQAIVSQSEVPQATGKILLYSDIRQYYYHATILIINETAVYTDRWTLWLEPTYTYFVYIQENNTLIVWPAGYARCKILLDPGDPFRVSVILPQALISNLPSLNTLNVKCYYYWNGEIEVEEYVINITDIFSVSTVSYNGYEAVRLTEKGDEDPTSYIYRKDGILLAVLDNEVIFAQLVAEDDIAKQPVTQPSQPPQTTTRAPPTITSPQTPSSPTSTSITSTSIPPSGTTSSIIDNTSPSGQSNTAQTTGTSMTETFKKETGGIKIGYVAVITVIIVIAVALLLMKRH